MQCFLGEQLLIHLRGLRGKSGGDARISRLRSSAAIAYNPNFTFIKKKKVKMEKGGNVAR